MKESCEELCMKYLDGEMTEEEEYHFKKLDESCNYSQDSFLNFHLFSYNHK